MLLDSKAMIDALAVRLLVALPQDGAEMRAVAADLIKIADSGITHVYDWLGTPATDDAERDAKEWLHQFAQANYYRAGRVNTFANNAAADWLAAHHLSCEFRGQRFQVTGHSRMGEVWLKESGSDHLYDHAVDLNECGNWRRLEI